MKLRAYKKFLTGTLMATVALVAGTASFSAVGGYKPYKGSASTDKPAAVESTATKESPKKAVEEHSAQALEHAKVAAIHGDAGHADILTEHAKVALEHAQAAVEVLTGEAKEHMKMGVTHLNEAIKHGNMGHADIANGHVKEAITHIKASIGS